MLKITVVCVGKIKEAFYREAIAEYGKRLGRYCRLEICETEDEKTPDQAGAAQTEQILKKEGERILKLLKPEARVVALAIDGRKRDSVAFADDIERFGLEGGSHLQFVIGGSLGLHSSVLRRADERLSFSDMTFPHQLMRVILLEQIYRGFRIIQGEPYHK